MIIVGLILLGLCLGSFVNALVWRIHEQSNRAGKKSIGKKQNDLSILHGRSMCTHCKHTLATIDLIPVLSWLSTRGRCRYCQKPVSIQYPIVEISSATLFIASYLWWPLTLAGSRYAVFVLWLFILAGLIALAVYDLRWKLLPNRIIAPLTVLAFIFTLIGVLEASNPLRAAINVLMALLVGGGIFYLLFQFSEGKWIGGGDVKLGWLIGIIVATPARAMLVIFMASILGTLVSLPFLASKRLSRHSTIPFGPFLIASAVLVVLFGSSILNWYQQTFFPYTY